MELESCRQIFEKYSSIELNENSFTGRQDVPCGRKERQTDWQTDITKLIVTFWNFVNVPQNHSLSRYFYFASISLKNKVLTIFLVPPVRRLRGPPTCRTTKKKALNVSLRHGNIYFFGAGDFSYFQIVQADSVVYPSFCSMDTSVLFPRKGGRSLMLAINPYLVTRLRMGRVVPLLPLCTFSGLDRDKFTLLNLIFVVTILISDNRYISTYIIYSCLLCFSFCK